MTAVLDLIGNIGGLQDGLILLVGWAVVFVNGRMFERALAGKLFKVSELPYKLKPDENRRNTSLTESDVGKLLSHLNSQKLLKLPNFTILLSNCCMLSRHRQTKKSIKKANDKVTKAMDVQTIMRS